jgi:hypothetical protein
MSGPQVLRQMELDLNEFAKKHPNQQTVIQDRQQRLKVLRAEINQVSFLTAALGLAAHEVEKRTSNTVLMGENNRLKAALGQKTAQLAQYTGYQRTDAPRKAGNLFLEVFLQIQLPALRKNPENIPALLKSGVLQKEAEKHPLLNQLIAELQQLANSLKPIKHSPRALHVYPFSESVYKYSFNPVKPC